MVTDARDAYRAGISGARSYPGSAGRGYDSAFQRGKRSAADFRRNRRLNQTRNNYGRNTNKTFITEAGDKLGNAIRSGGKKAKDMGIGAYSAMLKAGKELIIDPIMKSVENKQIMGDVYKNKKAMDFIRDSVMTPENEAFYQKYKKLAGFASDNQERKRLMDIANTARQNAQISSRINYGLGQLGYDTLGKEPFESYTKAMFGEANPRFNMENFTAGIESTGIGKAFLAEAEKAQANESGNSLIGNELANYGQRDILLDQNVPAQGKFLEQFDIAEKLTPLQKYLLQSQAQGRGGYAPDSEQAMINAGFDMDYIGPSTRMAISRYR